MIMWMQQTNQHKPMQHSDNKQCKPMQTDADHSILQDDALLRVCFFVRVLPNAMLYSYIEFTILLLLIWLGYTDLWYQVQVWGWAYGVGLELVSIYGYI